MNAKQIQILIEKFFDGATTLAEERQIYDYFSHGDVDDALKPYQPMFADMATLQPKAAIRPFRASFRWAVGIAASVLLVFGAYKAYNGYQYRQLANRYEGSYIIVDGQRIDDLSQIYQQIAQTLASAEQIEARLQGESVAEKAERELMSHISDPAEREQIEKLLNP